MNRHEWKAMHHAIRADARAFKEQHGGYPCFDREFRHRGKLWVLRRVRRDGLEWLTILKPVLIRSIPRGARIADELDTAAGHRSAMRRAPWTAFTHKRGCRRAIEIARELRLAA